MRFLRRPAGWALAGVLALTSLAACGAEGGGPSGGSGPAASQETYPVEVENCDQEVTISEPIERAVAVNQPALELLLSLGLGDRMVGYAISDDDVLPHLEEERVKVEPFDTEFPSFEAVLDREPDFLYTTFDYTFAAGGVAARERFADLGVSTYQSPSECSGQEAHQERELTLQHLYDEIEEVANLFGVPDRGTELVADLEDRTAAAHPTDQADEAGEGNEVSLAWWYAGTTTPYNAGCCGAPGLMTRTVGATNAVEDADQYWPGTSWESILDRDPTVLVLADLDRGDGDSAQDKIDFLESDPAASQLIAVREERYIILDGTTMDPSIRNVDGIEDLTDGLRDLGLVS